MAGFIASLLQGLDLIGLSACVGGLGFIPAVLTPRGISAKKLLVRPAGGLIILGALTVTGAELGIVLTQAYGLASEFGRWPWEALVASGFLRARVARAGLAVPLAVVAFRIRKHPAAHVPWCVAVLSGVSLLVCGGWLTHAVSRLEGGAALIAITVLHQLGAVLWAGGLLHLLALRRTLWRSGTDREWWPQALAHFSRLALLAVAVLAGAGLTLGARYVGDWQNLVGTSYGVMLLTKTILLATALGLAAANRRMIRRWQRRGETHGIQETVPALVEVEAALILIALLSAVSLTTLPPAVDIAGQRATLAQVVGVFSPHWPQLVPPPRSGAITTYTSPLDTFASPTDGDRWQSNFNHNVAGLLVLLIAVVAILDRTGRVGWARHWPLLFLGLAVFLFLYASPEAWPIGREGFWGQLVVPTVLQHRLATPLVILLALFEWRVQVGGLGGTRWRFGFPILAVVGGALLLTHTHTGFPTREAFLIEVSHNLLGLLAVLVGAGRWLELRLQGAPGRLGGIVWRTCLMGIGFVLLFYRE